MTTANKQIKISGLLYLISALLVVPFIPVLGSILLILGIVIYSNSFLSIEELRNNKVSLIIIIILSFILNIPAAILLLISLDEISNFKLEKNNAPPTTLENKRVDMLLKLGLSMVLISGILFATTSWEIISNLAKVFALVLMGSVFLGLSKFSEKTLKIPSTTKAYFILGLSFFLLTWVGLCYFGIISPWFSYVGGGSHITFFITLALIAVCLYLINYKFKEKEYIYMGHMTVYVALYHLFAAFGLDLLGASIILCTMSIVIALLPNDRFTATVKEINYIASYLYSILLLTQCFEANQIIVLIACTVNLVNLLYLCFKNNTVFNQIITTILSYVILTIFSLKLDIVSDNAILLFIIITIFSLILKYQKLNQNKSIVSTSQIIYNTISLILLLIIGFYSSEKALLVSILYLSTNIINSLGLSKTDRQIDLIVQPIAIYAFFASLIVIINENLVIISEVIPFLLAAITYMIIHYLSKDKQIKKYYYVFSIIAIALTFLINLGTEELYIAIINTILTTYLFFTRKDDDALKIIIYISILLNVLCSTNMLLYYNIPEIICNMLCLIVFVALTLTVKSNKLKIINYISIAIPLYNLVYMIDMAENLQLVVSNVFWLYILFLVLKFFVKNNQAKDWIAPIGIVILILPLIFESDILIGIYIGLISIALIFISINKEHYKKLFYTGIIITILNIVVRLWEFWTKVPIYLYLLLVGIALIGFVTYKELNRKKHPEKYCLNKINSAEQITPETLASNNFNNKYPSVQLQQGSDVAHFCPSCGKKNNGNKFCGDCGYNLQR